MGKAASVLILLGMALVGAWLILGIAFLHRLTGWQLEASGALGPVGILLFLAGVTIARKRKSA
jgi:hypothetical protein